MAEHPPRRRDQPLHVVQPEDRVAGLPRQLGQERRHRDGELLRTGILGRLRRYVQQAGQGRRQRAYEGGYRSGSGADLVEHGMACRLRQLVHRAQVLLHRGSQRCQRHRVV